VAEKGGLNKDGGISFKRKRNFEVKKKETKMFSRKPPDKPDKEEVEKKIDEKPRQVDKEQLLRQERLNAKLRKAKGVQAGGFAVNGGSIVGVLFALDSFVFNPSTLESLQLINDMFGLNIDFEKIIMTLQEHKAHLIGFFISIQTMIMGYKDTCQKMKERDTESFIEVVNDELGKIGA
jgi:hypothetical protein